MKALLCTRYGTPDDLELAELADPTPGPGQAVVRVKAAALNFFDTLIIAGKYQHKPAFPFSPAAEFAGEVESVGAGVTGFSPGDRVIGNIGWGAAREKVVRRRRPARRHAGRSGFRPRRRPHRHLWHVAACAEGPRPSSSRARRWPCWAPPAAPASPRSNSAS